jgi:hypothetical protein
MRKFALASLVGVALLLATTPSSASPFGQCPAIGADSMCAVLITIGPGGIPSYSTSGQGPYDGVEDTLVGVQNNSGATQLSIALTGSGIFALDGDGIGTPAAGWPNFGAPNGDCIALGCVNYNGVDSDGQLNTFTIADGDHGTVNFGTGLATGGSAFFSLEGPPTAITGVAPEPASLLLMGTGLMGLVSRMRRRRKS